MSDQNSILDKVMASKQVQDASQFIPSEFVLKLLKNLNSKEREILTKRFGLDGNKKRTLEQIGKDFQITRERIRQVQMSAIKKIQEMQDLKEEIENIENLISRTLEKNGGLMEENKLLEKLLNYSENSAQNKSAALFILEHLLEDGIEKITKNEDILSGWRINILPKDKTLEVLNILHEIIETENKLVELHKLVEKFKNHSYYQENKHVFYPDLLKDKENGSGNGDFKKAIESYLNISNKIDKNILEEWGLIKWPTIKPKRMSDKVYMILRKEEKPLHFKEIADYINKANFDAKIAHPATIHNELILNDKFVLIGRGIYALQEWGYNPGTVAEVIVEILNKTENALLKEDIINKVLENRMVKKSTINLALTDKSKFKKLENNTYIVI
ncbi:hypothetical protein KKA15_05740 [Patescibacteria group bacterium]|nr:hypothetical protein [Patescibacteria group bacterium]